MKRETFSDKIISGIMKQYTHEELTKEYLKVREENEKLKTEIRLLKYETNKLYGKLDYLNK